MPASEFGAGKNYFIKLEHQHFYLSSNAFHKPYYTFLDLNG